MGKSIAQFIQARQEIKRLHQAMIILSQHRKLIDFLAK